MENSDSLVAAIVDEDRRLRDLIDRFPPDRRDKEGPAGALSVKETLGHLAFWDSYAVLFFEGRLDGEGEGGVVDFERRNRQEMKRLRGLPWDEVLALYGDATVSLARFLSARWRDLSDKERLDFVTPLRHRRHHRMLLQRALEGMEPRERADRA